MAVVLRAIALASGGLDLPIPSVHDDATFRFRAAPMHRRSVVRRAPPLRTPPCRANAPGHARDDAHAHAR